MLYTENNIYFSPAYSISFNHFSVTFHPLVSIPILIPSFESFLIYLGNNFIIVGSPPVIDKHFSLESEKISTNFPHNSLNDLLFFDIFLKFSSLSLQHLQFAGHLVVILKLTFIFIPLQNFIN